MERANLTRIGNLLRRRLTYRQWHSLVLLWTVIHVLREWRQRRAQRTNCFWVRPIFRNRCSVGAFNTLVQELRTVDPERHFNYFHMTREVFTHLVDLLRPYIQKHNTVMRRSISAEERLAITLRYLASGDLQRSISYQFWVSHQTVSEIIHETCNAIWTALAPMVMPRPTQSKWTAVSQQFWMMWDFPNCCGAIDGKHIQIEAPNKSGSEFFNYKKTFSIVLLGVCDAAYRFTVVDIGSSGSRSDGGIFADSAFGKALVNGSLHLPPPAPLPFSNNVVPSVFVGDAAFPLKTYMMRPYPGLDLAPNKAVFNYRLSRARRTIENAFGILAARFRILCRPINTSLDTADGIVKACVCLHNYIKGQDDECAVNTRHYCPSRFVDHEGPDGEILPGEWRNICAHDSGLMDVTRTGSNNHSIVASDVRETFADYFLSREGSVPWQECVINRGHPQTE